MVGWSVVADAAGAIPPILCHFGHWNPGLSPIDQAGTCQWHTPGHA